MKLTKNVLMTLAATLALVGPACDDKKEEDKKADAKKADAKDTKAKAEVKAEVKAEPAKADDAKAAPAAAPAKIGVAECDEYIEKYSKCIQEKMPEASRKQTQDALDLSVKAWTEAAKGPGKDSLAAGCKTALDAAKKATASMGCTW